MAQLVWHAPSAHGLCTIRALTIAVRSRAPPPPGRRGDQYVKSNVTGVSLGKAALFSLPVPSGSPQQHQGILERPPCTSGYRQCMEIQLIWSDPSSCRTACPPFHGISSLYNMFTAFSRRRACFCLIIELARLFYPWVG